MDNKTKQEIIADYDSKHKRILEAIREGNEDVANFERPGYPFAIIDNLLYNVDRKGNKRLCIPRAQVGKFLAMAHDDKHHFGKRRMMEELEPYAMDSKTRRVLAYLKHCNGCRTCNTDREKPYGDYQPIRPEDSRPMKTIAIDFIVGLPVTPSSGTPWQLESFEQYDAMMTVTCATSKRSLLIPGHSTYTAEDWAASLARLILICDWGVPTGIISDRDRKFTAAFWKGLWKSLGSRLLMTTAYHPQGDGLSERKNQTVEIAIRHYLFQYPDRTWVDVVPSLQWNLNSAYSEPIKSSPHEQLFGFRLPGFSDVLAHTDEQESAENLRFVRDHLRKDAEVSMDFAAARAKRYYDAKHKMIEFQEGDEVYLRLHEGYHLPGKPSRKYSQQKAGPWKVKRRIGRLAYEIDLPETFGIHPVISVAHLSPGRQGEDPFHRTAPPPGPVEDDQPDPEEKGESFEIEIIMRHRINRTKDGFDYLVKWKGYGHEDNWWRSEWQLRTARELVEEYWDRHGGRPELGAKATVAEAEAVAPRKRGRPRKKVD
ncbi:hypothetical protein ONZ43_g7077 [Nemania bipapillata]|uniref:Uncharacterized protein n=1 Tax=Nemania bipapillata TaxID=110536 RepID=A0ACC2HU69_9PEZI|nr:hypothetical protein ONZ43_g7077 [Nemania bipapillata]